MKRSRARASPLKSAFPFDVIEVAEFFNRYLGPVQRVFEALDEKGQSELRNDLVRLWTENNRATDVTTQNEAEYLEVVAVRG